MVGIVEAAIGVNRTSEIELFERAESMLSLGLPFQMTPLEKSICFLRGLDSRAGHALVAFYMLLGSNNENVDSGSCSINGYPGRIFHNYTNFSSVNHVALACRKAFDHGIKGGVLTGAVFAKTDNCTIEEHAKLWTKCSNRPIEDSRKALYFLRNFFKLCSKNNTQLLKSNSILGKRIALIKQYADRTASHLSLSDHNIKVDDIAHVVASLVLVAEINRSFYRTEREGSHFNDIDMAAHEAAKTLFPNIIEHRLFKHTNVCTQAESCWKYDEEGGLQMLMEQLPYIISFFKGL